MSEQFIYLDLRDPHPQFLGTIAVSTIVCSILPRLLTPRGSFWCTEPIHGPSSQAITGHFIPRAIVTMVDGDVLLSCIVHLESDVVLPRSWRHISRLHGDQDWMPGYSFQRSQVSFCPHSLHFDLSMLFAFSNCESLVMLIWPDRLVLRCQVFGTFFARPILRSAWFTIPEIF